MTSHMTCYIRSESFILVDQVWICAQLQVSRSVKFCSYRPLRNVSLIEFKILSSFYPSITRYLFHYFGLFKHHVMWKISSWRPVRGFELTTFRGWVYNPNQYFVLPMTCCYYYYYYYYLIVAFFSGGKGTVWPDWKIY